MSFWIATEGICASAAAPIYRHLLICTHVIRCYYRNMRQYSILQMNLIIHIRRATMNAKGSNMNALPPRMQMTTSTLSLPSTQLMGITIYSS